MTDWFDRLPRRLLAEVSVWSADLLRLADDLARMEPHADLLHLDVSDGHFAPALLLFPDLVAAIRRASAVPLHVHLMVADHILLAQVAQFVEAGADLISVHVENANAADALTAIRAAGRRAGVVLRVDTPVGVMAPLLPHVDMVTLLGTAIGVKGQDLHLSAPERIHMARALAAGEGRRILVAADGGIREHTVPQLRAAGADTVVLGSLAFGAPDLAARMSWVKGLQSRFAGRGSAS